MNASGGKECGGSAALQPFSSCSNIPWTGHLSASVGNTEHSCCGPIHGRVTIVVLALGLQQFNATEDCSFGCALFDSPLAGVLMKLRRSQRENALEMHSESFSSLADCTDFFSSSLGC